MNDTMTSEHATNKTSMAPFATPDREGGGDSLPTVKKNASQAHTTPKAPNSVTPPESATREQLAGVGKQVRFNSDDAKTAKENGQEPISGTPDSKGLVSRRGGRYGSPGRGRPRDAVLEYKTYRSPQRTRAVVKEENDMVPSLCSSKSSELASSSFANDVATNCPLEKLETPENDVPVPVEDDRPNSISVDPSLADTTSPLTSSPSRKETNMRATTPPKRDEIKEDKRMMHSPPNSDATSLPADKTKTPMRSPVPSEFHSLPSLHDAKMSSPCGTFLSPYLPSPSPYTTLAADQYFDGDDPRRKRFEEEKSPKLRDHDRARAVATPTDFAVDFGKGHKASPSFDASNVLAWLQSPTANGLFSPGGLGSAHGTPRGFGGPRTPRTPTVSTSFFFSDVASLPRNGDFASPKPGTVPRQSGAAGMSSMICISPLASSRRKHRDSRTNTPMNFKDVFASPRNPNASIKPRNMPLLGDSPSKGTRSRARSDASLDAVDMAERDLLEDEDLSVLLQLASHSRGNTPRGKKEENGAHVFRSPRDRKASGYGRDDRLQLPMIGNAEGGTTKLTRKSHGRSDANADDFNPPPLSIRGSTSSGGSREIFSRGDDEADPDKVASNEHSNDPREGPRKKVNSQHTSKGNLLKKSSKKLPPPGYPMAHAHYHHPDAPPYYHMPHTMPPGGSMRVVVGGPPPMRGKKGAGSPSRPHGSSSPRHPHHMEGPYGGPYPGPYPPPPPGVYPSYPPPPYMSGGGPPPYSHYPPPPPRHMPMYAAQHPPNGPLKGGSKKQKLSKSSKGAPNNNKRPAPPTPGKVLSSAQKKLKKSPIKTLSAKKKSPTPVSAERHTAAVPIHVADTISSSMNDKAAALAAAILRGVTMRPSGKWQAQLYYAGKSRYIGVFDTREKAALAYEIAREKLKADNRTPADQSAQSLKATENAVNSARKAAFEGVNEKDPRAPSSS